MKKISGLFIMIFLLVGTFGIVTAEDTGNSIPTPNKIGFFENLMFKLNLAFTFNKENKIEKIFNMAERRLAEAEMFAEENPEEMEKAQERYNALVMRVEEISEKIANVENENENLSISEMEKLTRIQNRFEMHRENTERIYIRAIERFEENNASYEKIERFENFYERASTHNDDMEAKIIQNRGKVIERHKILVRKSDEEIKTILKKIEKKEGLTDARAKRAERDEIRVQKLVKIKQENVNRVEEHLNEPNLTDEQKAQIQNRIEAANQNIQKVEVKARERVEAYEKIMESNILKNTVGQGVK